VAGREEEGALGRASLSPSTAADYSCRLQRHLLPFFAEHRIDAIDRPLCERSKQHKLREAEELPAALEAGADIRDRRGRRAVPLGPASLRKLVDCLAAVLDEAIEDRHIETNPARSHRMKVRVPKPRRTFLEIDELAAILDAAAFQDGPALLQARMRLGPTASMVAGLLGQGLSAKQIAGRLGIAQSTVSYHVGRIVAAHGATPAGGSSSRSSVAGACAPASCAR
jgi:hypothetical protein